MAEPLPYPGHIVELGETDAATVRAIQRRLNQLGCGPLAESGSFGPEVRNAVKLFQARFPDSHGIPLKMDGRVGPITWAVLFGVGSVPLATAAPGPLLAAML